jgi:hypothetical protein
MMAGLVRDCRLVGYFERLAASVLTSFLAPESNEKGLTYA